MTTHYSNPYLTSNSLSTSDWVVFFLFCPWCWTPWAGWGSDVLHTPHISVSCSMYDILGTFLFCVSIYVLYMGMLKLTQWMDRLWESERPLLLYKYSLEWVWEQHWSLWSLYLTSHCSNIREFSIDTTCLLIDSVRDFRCRPSLSELTEVTFSALKDSGFMFSGSGLISMKGSL